MAVSIRQMLPLSHQFPTHPVIMALHAAYGSVQQLPLLLLISLLCSSVIRGAVAGNPTYIAPPSTLPAWASPVPVADPPEPISMKRDALE